MDEGIARHFGIDWAKALRSRSPADGERFELAAGTILEDVLSKENRSFGGYTSKHLSLSPGELPSTFSFVSVLRDSFDKKEIEIFQFLDKQIAIAADRQLQNDRLALLREATFGGVNHLGARDQQSPRIAR